MPTINKPKKKAKSLTLNEQIRKEVYSTSKWRKLRDAYLIDHPLCEMCLEANKITPTEDIHHIISFVGISDPLRRNEIAFDYNNLKALCKVCHQKVHNS